MRRTAYSAWKGDPPKIEAIAQPMPDAPYLPLTGGGSSDKSVQTFLQVLEHDVQHQTGRFFEYVWGFHPSCDGDGDEADMFVLQDWEVCQPERGYYEAIVILYYYPLNPYLCLQKHFGQAAADEYLESIAGLVQMEMATDE
jgi:hypothetical protein